MQGTAVGRKAGLGNAGVTTMQFVVPLVMTFALFGALSGDPLTLQTTSGTLIGKIPAGAPTWIPNAGFVWLLIPAPLASARRSRRNHTPPADVTPEDARGEMEAKKAAGYYTAEPTPAAAALAGTKGRGLTDYWVSWPT